MKRLVIILIFATFAIVLNACSKEEVNLENINQFKYFLDKGNDPIGNQMKKMDLVIVEPIEMQQRYITDAQKSGTYVYGYINAMEGDKWNKELYRLFEEDDFYHDVDGERMYFEQWDSYMMDMTSSHYQQILLKEIEKQVVEKGLNGVFLDTVGNIESFLPKKEQHAQNEAIQAFMKKIKNTYDGLSIGQNWGFHTLYDYTASYVDFFMWEDFSYDEVGNDEWALNQMKRLQKLREKQGIEVLTIGFRDESKSRELANKHGFNYVHNSAGSYYNEW